ncbi:MAG: hypothetical protein HQL90_15855 [Magnetococcales bacterium]|nr:hypothetical protein [Magnetococcales bacterium]
MHGQQVAPVGVGKLKEIVMQDKTVTSPVLNGAKKEPKVNEKPFTDRMQRLLAGKREEDIILDPDNPNLILERKQSGDS